jgi:nucleotidyltransferase/DNA polymerase involved in DNA repair
VGRSQEIGRPGPPSGPPADDTGCPILHVDMDAFYASAELRRRPELRGRPVIVGGGRRGVVLSATYEARAYGVRSAMPMGLALARCPDAVVVPPDMARYATVSAGVMAVFRSVTPLVEPLSLDEAFLDVSGARRRLGRPGWIGEWIRARIADEQGITCSVGVAPTKFLAKLASSRCKPDGLLVVPVDGVEEFLHPLPVGALWGVGEKTAAALAGLGLRTVGDLAVLPLPALTRAVGEATAAHLHALANGLDPRPVVPHEPDRSIGAEETFGADVDEHPVVHRELLRLAEKSAARLRSSGQAGRTVSIKIRFADFSTITRARTLPSPTDAGHEIYATARALYDALELDRPRIRLVGVRVEGIAAAGEANRQLELGAREYGWRDAERAVDRAVDRFGSGAVRPATLVGPTQNTGAAGADTAGQMSGIGRVERSQHP